VDKRTQNALEENEGPEPEPVQVDRKMKVFNLTGGIRLTQAGIRLSAETGYNEKRTAAPGQRI